MRNMPPKNVKEYIYQNIQILTGLAIYHLDSLPTQVPEFEGIPKDLREAQLAIDAIKALSDLLKDRITSQEKAGIEALLRDLQLRYVEKKKLS